ncbi:xanthine dehydrogenase accessory protein XdhC [Massilia sp. S19_KUP03_FR1]|uniref:xanthine dehydrogenase accessory protein XdhC n=1 Tax=Massilia sp. S19_KUP03_FR1 TaxID=3025503 RepID=UPI002FCD585A
MDDWLTGAQRTLAPAVLVTVATTEGSVPREAGAHMLVTSSTQFDTIGGGHLELKAMALARAMLVDGRTRHFERFPLGPSLGQCCGGVAHLLFERFDPAQRARLQRRRDVDTFRLLALDGAASALCDASGKVLSGDAVPAFDADAGTHVMRDQDGRRWLVDAVLAPRAHLFLFGAGHVGAAIVRLLGSLPCRVTWVDEREDQFPDSVPANVHIEATDTPEASAASAPRGASFLVMTHSHALDQRLCEAILARDSADWFGLIGSMTKRRQFEHRLRARGLDHDRIDAMVCPIGVPGVTGKQPAVIAIAVVAQLLSVWEARHTAPAARAVSSERS